MGTVLLGMLGLAMMGCSGTSGGGGTTDGTREDKLGQLALPLVTQGASGVTYRLRDATFAVHHNVYSMGYGGYGGGGGIDQVVNVSSETDPSAATISLSVEEGQYYIELLPGWHFEKDGPNGAEAVEATLLSGETQWVWVGRRSTSFAEFQFGLGDRQLWLNGELNIGVVLYENPSEIGGYGGYGGAYPMGGSTAYGSAAGAAGGMPSAGGGG